MLHANRARVLGLVSEIVPGHGPRFVSRRTHTALIANGDDASEAHPDPQRELDDDVAARSPSLVRFAVEAEQAGFDAVMVSEHVVLGPGADSDGLPSNPRDYALPGNQDPATPWPSSLVLLSAVAAVTTRLRLVAGAIIPPLRHPLLVAKDLATLDLLSRGTAGRPADRELAPRRVRRARRPVRGAGASCSTSTSRPGTCCGATHRRRSKARFTGSTTSTSSRNRSGRKGRRSGSAAARSTTGWSTHRHVRSRLQPSGPSRPRTSTAARGDGRRRAGTWTSSRWSAGRAASSPIRRAWPTSDGRCPRSRNRSRLGSRRSASSRPSSSTMRRGFGAFCREVVERVSALVG